MNQTGQVHAAARAGRERRGVRGSELCCAGLGRTCRKHAAERQRTDCGRHPKLHVTLPLGIRRHWLLLVRPFTTLILAGAAVSRVLEGGPAERVTWQRMPPSRVTRCDISTE